MKKRLLLFLFNLCALFLFAQKAYIDFENEIPNPIPEYSYPIDIWSEIICNSDNKEEDMERENRPTEILDDSILQRCGSSTYSFCFPLPDSCDLDCPNNIISNPGFTQNTLGTGDLGTIATTDSWTSGALSPQIAAAGHCDPYSMQSWGDDTVKESYCQSGVNILQGHTYRVSFSAKFAPINTNTAVNYVNIRISADNACPTINDYNPTTAHIIGVVANINSQSWTTYTLPDWISPANLNTIIVNAENFLPTDPQASTISWAHVDNICITEVVPVDSLCCQDENYFFQQVIPATQIINNAPNVTVQNLLLGDCHQVRIDWGDGTITGPFSGTQLPQSHQYSNDGMYYVCVIIEEILDGAQCWIGEYCENTSILINATDEMKVLLEEIKCYPNPATDFITIEVPGNIALSELKLYDVHGRLVKQVDARDNTATLPLAQYPEGIYFISVTATDGRFRSLRILKKP